MYFKGFMLYFTKVDFSQESFESVCPYCINLFLQNQEEQENLGLAFEGNGEFFMSMVDFVRNFDKVEICNLTSEGIDDANDGKLSWHETKANGAWIKGFD